MDAMIFGGEIQVFGHSPWTLSPRNRHLRCILRDSLPGAPLWRVPVISRRGKVLVSQGSLLTRTVASCELKQWDTLTMEITRPSMLCKTASVRTLDPIVNDYTLD